MITKNVNDLIREIENLKKLVTKMLDEAIEDDTVKVDEFDIISTCYDSINELEIMCIAFKANKEDN